MTGVRRVGGRAALRRLLLASAVAATVLLVRGTVPDARADATRDGPFGWTYATYAPGLYGPDVPLATLLEQAGIALVDGELADARLLVIKAERRVELWVGPRMIKAYRAQLGQRADGDKSRRGDKRTPEGDYAICAKKPSKYHRALWLSYPSLDDAEAALRARRISRADYERITAALGRGDCPPFNTALGGLILIHGQQPSLTASRLAAQRRKPHGLREGLEPGDADPAAMREYLDWTNGCVSLFNSDIRELFALLPVGTPVTILARGPVTRPPARPAVTARSGAPR